MARAVIGKAFFLSFRPKARNVSSTFKDVNEHSISFLLGRTGMEGFRGMKMVSRMQKASFTGFVKLR